MNPKSWQINYDTLLLAWVGMVAYLSFKRQKRPLRAVHMECGDICHRTGFSCWDQQLNLGTTGRLIRGQQAAGALYDVHAPDELHRFRNCAAKPSQTAQPVAVGTAEKKTSSRRAELSMTD